jgi:hypothetical protein
MLLLRIFLMPLRTAHVSRVGAFFSCSALLAVVFFSLALTGAAAFPLQDAPPAVPKQSDSEAYYANAHPYLEETLDKLAQQIPELQTIQPAPNQQALPGILEKTGQQVDEFLQNVIDVIAHEDIIEQKLDKQEHVTASWRLQDSFLILRHGNEFSGHLSEYRMDAKGNRIENVGTDQGFIVTSNFSLSRIYFSTSLQPESTFLYLGDDKIASHDAYVVAFAQKPADATVTSTFDEGARPGAHFLVHMLVQGIAWIDKSTFQIIRMRTDLLAPRSEIRLDAMTTTLSFAEVPVSAITAPLWLPRDVSVYIESQGKRFRNEHHYSDYQSYLVSVRMIPDQATIPRAVSPAEEPTEENDQSYYAKAHPYLDEPLTELTKRIPELKQLQPASDQSQLPSILAKTGANADDFFRHVTDLIADEKITQHRLNGKGRVTASEEVRDNYLILRHPRAEGHQNDIVEYRMDASGNRLDNVGLYRGYLVTFGFALICNYFSSSFQEESTFRYLGDEKIGSHDTYVVAFAQEPGKTTLVVTMAGARGTTTRMLMQGVAWIDKGNFQILQMRTDLLAPRPELDLDRQTTEVTFDKVQLADLAAPLWLPSKVKVSLEFTKFDSEHHRSDEFGFRNEHRYSDYRHYNVSVKMLVPQK